MAGIYKMVGSGAVAAADIAVTLTAGSADVDVSSATVPRNYKGHLLKIYDSSNRCIQGFVYTNGAGTVQNIVSAKGGSTRNWAAQAAGFDDTTNCRYELWQVNNAVEVASGSIAAGEMLADTTATNAFVAPVGVDLSAYQTGKYIFAAYNTVGGYAAFGYIKGTAPGGETLGAELNPNWKNSTLNWDTFNAATKDITSIVALTDAYRLAVTNDTTTAGWLLKHVITPTLNSGQMLYHSWHDGLSYIGNGTLAAGANTFYVNKLITRANSVYLQNTLATNYSAVSALKRVTDCAATGALIVSAKDGATRAWAYQHASFNPNIASTYKCFYVGD